MRTRTFRSAKAAVAAALGLATIVAGLGTPALAWNRPGHMVSGAIACQELRRTNPQALGRVVALLKRHPDYERLWRARVKDAQAQGIDEAEALLMQAARWPDDARARLRGREGWHYINLPYAPNGGPAPEPPAVNILSAYQTNLGLVRGSGLPPGRQGRIARAEALCWVLHLVGDVHQPLHTVSLFLAPQFGGRTGDRGGTRFYIRARADRATISLHTLWDDMVLGSERPRSVSQKATLLRSTYGRGALPELADETDFRNWAQREGLSLAHATAYQQGTLQSGPNKRSGVVLPPGYLEEAKPVAEKRLALAGYRLADLLARLFR
jgi:hypothetical protein